MASLPSPSKTRADDELARRRCNRRANRPTFGWESLTPSERDVADLVTTGLTNREAAARLYLSSHTVGFHLRQIFRKLDINSRVELTRVMVQREYESQGAAS